MAKTETLDQPLIPGIPGGLSFTQLFHIFRAYFLFIAIIGALVIALTLAMLKVIPKTYESTAAIIVDFQSDDPSGGQALPSALEASYLATQIDVMNSQKVMLKVVERLGLDQDPELQQAFSAAEGKGSIKDFIITEVLQENLVLSVDDQSRVIKITYAADDPEVAADVANAVVDAYIETNRELEQQPAQELADSFREQLGRLKQRVEDAQDQLSQFQQDRKLIDLDDNRADRADVEKAHLLDLTNQLVAAEAKWREAQVRLQRLREAETSGLSMGNQPEVLTSDTITAIKAKLLDLEVEFEEIQGVLGRNHPRYKSLQDEIARARQKLNEEINNWSDSVLAEAQIASEQYRALQREVERQRRRVLDVKKDRSDLQQYRRELESAEQIYKSALGQFDKVLLGSELVRTNVGVVSWAVPPTRHVRPRKLIALMIAAVLGGMLGCGLALLIELSNRRIRCKEDLDSVLDAPTLAEVGK